MKPDELAIRAYVEWVNVTCVGDCQEKYVEIISKALKEYGEHVRAEAVKLCLEVNTDRMPSPSLEGFTVTNSGLGCASVISKMELP